MSKELKPETIYFAHENGDSCAADMYMKSEADAILAEKDEEIARLKADAAETLTLLEERNKQVGELTENERRLKRALWIARAYRGRDNSILLPSKFMRNVWDNIERKCLKKAEEYK